MIKKIMLLALIFTINSFAQNIGTGLTFLKLGIGARSIAMGEAFTAVTDDNGSTSYNPATLRSASHNEIALMHKEWIEGTTSEYLGTTILGDKFTYAISVLKTSVSDIEIRNMPGPSEGTFSAKNFALGGTMSLSPADNFSLGVTGKFLYEKIFTDEASGYGIDVGALYKATDNFFIGTSILQIGSMSHLRNESSVLPTSWRLGASYGDAINEEFSFLASLDGNKTFKDSNSHFNFGGEITYNQLIALRVGYQTGYETRSFSTGLGVSYGIVRFDYAFVPFTGGFNSTHTFSVSFLI